MKKKILAMLMSVVMLTGVLSACGGGSGSGGAGSTDGSGSGGQAQTPTIKVWIPPYAKTDAELTDQMFWDQQFDAFEAENNCTVQVEIVPWDGYKQKVTTGLISNEGPDVVYIDTPYDLVESGAFEPLDDYFTAEELDNYLYWDLGQILGKHYIAPMLVGNASVLYCNMDILNQAGFDRPPETWDELIEYCLAIKEKVPTTKVTVQEEGKEAQEVEKEVSPFLQNWGSKTNGAINLSFLPYYWQTGEEFLDAEGKPSINNAGGLQTVEFLKKFMDVGIFDETITAQQNPRDGFREGSVAMYMGDTGSAKKNAEFVPNWAVTPALKGPQGKQVTWIAADSVAVASNSQNKELAVKALKYMLSAPVMDAFHEKMYAMCPITKDAQFYDVEQFRTMYLEQPELFKNWPSFANSDAFYDYLKKNIQGMYMGELTPQQVLEDTMKQYEDFVS